MSSNEVGLKFVQDDCGDDCDGRLLQQACDKAKAKGVPVQMVSKTELQEHDLSNDKSVFVVKVFHGECFKLLVAAKKRIFGSICLLQLLEMEMPLPGVYHPMYSLAMKDALVCCSSVARPERNKLYELVEYMGGVATKDFTSAVTHLVAGEVGSAKYIIASNQKKAVVLPSWVQEAWKKTRDCDFDAKEPVFVEAHRCPIFKGCMVCVTGLEFAKRKEIRAIVENNGGSYCADLKLNKTTHLLVESPTGEKYEFALRWKLHCVRPDWVYDCAKAGYCLSEMDYAINADKDFEKLHSNKSLLDVTTVNATLNSTIGGCKAVSKKAAEAARRSASIHSREDIFNESRVSAAAPVSSKMSGGNQIGAKDIFDFNIPIPSDTMFLDGCKIYLTGFTGQKLEFLQKIINAGGATRFNQINGSISHVVMGEKLERDVNMLAKCGLSPHVVSGKWLLDCCKQVKCLPEQDYYCMDPDNDDEEITRPVDESENIKRPQPGQPSKKESVAPDNDDILHQYLELMHDDEQSMVDNEVTMTVANKTAPGPNEILEPDLAEQDANLINIEESRRIFRGEKMRLEGFSEPLGNQLKYAIKVGGGNVLEETSKETADYLVLPTNYVCENSRAHAMVTLCWLQCCLEVGQLLDPASNFLFIPFSLAKNVYPLKGYVVSISQYSGSERTHLMELAQMLGANCQEQLCRNGDGNLLANTHLLLKTPTGSKYEAAQRWNLSILSTEWLFDCARTGTKVAEGPYSVNKERQQEEEEEVEEVVVEVGIDQAGEPMSVPELPRDVAERSVDDDNDLTRSDLDESDTTKEENLPSDNTRTGNKTASEDPSAAASADVKPGMKKPPSSFDLLKRPSFDLTEALEALRSPCCSSGGSSSSAQSRRSRSSRSSFALDDFFQEHMQAALKYTATLAGISIDTSSAQCSSMNKGNQSDTKKDAAKEEQQSYLDGVVLTVSKKLAKQQAEIHNIASAAGAQCKLNLEPTCTHIIHEGRTTKEHNQAKCKGVQVVSPHWLYACVEEQRHIDESMYPSNFNPKLSLSVVTTRRSDHSSAGRRNSTRAEDISGKTEDDLQTCSQSTLLDATRNDSCTISSVPEANGEVEAVANNETRASRTSDVDAAAQSQDSEQSDSYRTKEEIRQLQGIMQALKGTRRRSRRLNSGKSGSHSRSSSANSDCSRSIARRQSSRLRSLRSGLTDSDEDNARQVMDEIIYDDPASRIEREKIIARLSNSSPTPHSNSDSSEDDNKEGEKGDKKCDGKKNRTNYVKTPPAKTESSSLSPSPSLTPVAPPIALHITSASEKPEPVSLLDPVVDAEEVKRRETPKFLLSSMSAQEKIDYGALIEKLGGEVFDVKYFNPACGHTVVGQLCRSEKCLASIAAGNWLLHKSYLEASRTAGHFVDEEAHEWGVELPGESLSRFARSVKRWRLELTQKSQQQNTKVGAFQNWKVLLCVESRLVATLTRTLKAGCAEVLETSPPFNDVTGATHAFISADTSSPVDKVDFKRLERAGVFVLKTEYLAAYLTETNPAPCQNSYIFRKPEDRLNLTTRKRKPSDKYFTTETAGKRKKMLQESMRDSFSSQ